jgi:hypothetical protein
VAEQGGSSGRGDRDAGEWPGRWLRAVSRPPRMGPLLIHEIVVVVGLAALVGLDVVVTDAGGGLLVVDEGDAGRFLERRPR